MGSCELFISLFFCAVSFAFLGAQAQSALTMLRKALICVCVWPWGLFTVCPLLLLLFWSPFQLVYFVPSQAASHGQRAHAYGMPKHCAAALHRPICVIFFFYIYMYTHTHIGLFLLFFFLSVYSNRPVLPLLPAPFLLAVTALVFNFLQIVRVCVFSGR